METDITTLQKLLETKDKALRELKASYEQFKEEAIEYERELEADNEHKEKEIDSLVTKLEAAAKKIEEYKKEINQSNRIMEREKGKIDHLNEELSALRQKIVNLEQLNEDLESDLRNIKFEKQELVEKIEAVEEKFVLEKEDLEEQIILKNEELERFRLEMHECEDEIVLWKRKSTPRPSILMRSESLSFGDSGDGVDADKVTKLLDEISKYRDDLERLRDQVEDKNLEIRRYREQIDKMQENIDSFKGMLHQKEREVEGLGYEAGGGLRVAQQLEEVRNEHHTFQEKKHHDDHQLNGSICIEEDQESQKTGADSRAKEESERLQIELQEKEETINLLQAEVLRMRNDFEDERDHKFHLENFILELSNELEGEKATNSELKKEIECLKGQAQVEIQSVHSENREGEDKQSAENSFIENMSQQDDDKEDFDGGYEEEPETNEEEQGIDQQETRDIESIVDKLQEENAQLSEKYERLVEMAGFLNDKLSSIQEDKVRLEKEVRNKDNKIDLLEKMYTELQQEIVRMRNEVDNSERYAQVGSFSSDKVPRLNILDAYRSDLDTMPSENYNLTSKSQHNLFISNTLLGNKNGPTNSKEFGKLLYIKPVEAETPSYFTVQDQPSDVSSIKAEKNEASYLVDEIVSSVNDINVKEILGCPLESVLGQNLLFLIYGPKRTDKKQIRYRILQDFISIYRAMSLKKEFKENVCKLTIKIQDPTLLGKAERAKSSSSLERFEKPNEFTIGEMHSEQDLYEYLKYIKEVDFNKNGKNNQKDKRTKKESIGLKQIVLELSVEKAKASGKVGLPNVSANKEGYKSQNGDLISKTKIVIVTVNNELHQGCESALGVFVKKGKLNQENNIKRFLVLTINPYLTNDSYKATSETLAILEKIENCETSEETVVTPVNQFEKKNGTTFTPDKINEEEFASPEEKVSLPKNFKNSVIIRDYINPSPSSSEQKHPSHTHNISMYSMASMQSKENQELAKKFHKYSTSNNFLQDNMSRLFGFVNKFKKSKKQQRNYSVSDPRMSVMSTISTGQNNSNVVRKLVSQLD